MSYIHRGTTPIHKFVGPTDLSDASRMFISYAQNGKIILEKTLDDVTITKDPETDFCVVSVRLTQEETLIFDEHVQTSIQIRVAFPNETALASNIIVTSTARILKEGVI